MSGDVEIFNLALNACGVEIGVTSPDENSREAALCRLWYPQVRDNVLASAPWSSVRKQSRLARLKTRNMSEPWAAGDPTPDYLFAYAVPSDLLRPYHLHRYLRFSFGLVDGTRAISANEPDPILFYNARVTDSSQWESELRLAVIHTLATYLALPVSGSVERLQVNAQLAFDAVETAQTGAANEQNEQEETLPEWITTRGYGNPTSQRYYYPMQSLAVGAAK